MLTKAAHVSSLANAKQESWQLNQKLGAPSLDRLPRKAGDAIFEMLL
jgi:hypothetical protein